MSISVKFGLIFKVTFVEKKHFLLNQPLKDCFDNTLDDYHNYWGIPPLHSLNYS